MKKRILITISNEQLKRIDDLAKKEGYSRSAYIASFTGVAKGKKIPKELRYKDQIAEYLNISKMDKKYNTFMDNVIMYYNE